jgi:hypothetical protein
VLRRRSPLCRPLSFQRRGASSNELSLSGLSFGELSLGWLVLKPLPLDLLEVRSTAPARCVKSGRTLFFSMESPAMIEAALNGVLQRLWRSASR